jgi:glycosyltransferase involved in cell wall biosynthesis
MIKTKAKGIKSKKLVHLTNIPTPYRVNFFNNLNKILKKKGIELFVIYCAKTEPNRNWIFKNFNFKFKYIVLKGITLNIYGIYFHLNPSILNILQKLSPDILLNAGSWNMPSALLSLIALRNNSNCTKIFWSEGHSKSVRNSSGFIAFLRRFFLNKYDYFFVPNEKSQEFLLKDSGIDKSKTNFLANSIQEHYFYKPNKLVKQEYRILSIVASFEERKGFINFLNAIEKLSKKTKSKIHLELVGNGPLFNLIREKLIQNKISYKINQNLSAKDIADILHKSHGFILPSLIDPNPLSAIEALAAGLPLLMSDFCGNVNECIIHNKNGWIFNPLDQNQIKKSIEIWSSTTINDLNKMGSISRKRYKDLYSIKKICNEFANDLNKIVFDN